jgi:small-conductance mechanosensitive channel
LDWVSISASVVAVLSLLASVFSAIGAAKSADVATQAERRVKAGERTNAVRELMRSAVKIELQGKLVILALEDASRSAIATAEMHGTPEGKSPFLKANNEFQEKISEITQRVKHGVDREVIVSLDDDQVAAMQLDLDKLLSTLQGDSTWANKRAEQLAYANRSSAEDLVAAERAVNIYAKRTHEGKLG